MDIFTADDSKSKSIEKAAGAVNRAAARIVLSITRSVNYLKPALAERLAALLSPSSLWTVGVIMAAWVIATVIGGPIALAVNTLLGLYGLYELYEQLAVTWQSLRAWAKTAYEAKNDSELNTAARYFADAIAEGGLALIEALITHKIFKSVEGSIRKRYPPPEWLESEYAKSIEPKRTGRAREKLGEREGNERDRVAKDRTTVEPPPAVPPPPIVPPPGDSVLPAVLGVVTAVGVASAAVYSFSKRK